MDIAASETRVADFSPECPCGVSGITFIEAHPVDRCAGQPEAADARFLCEGCLKKEIKRIQARLFHAFLGLRPSECTGCARPAVNLSDIIVRLQPLTVWPE